MTNEKTLYRSTKLIWYIFYVIETLLFFRFALKLFAANPGAGFTQFIYSLSSVFVAPFKFVFGIEIPFFSVLSDMKRTAMIVVFKTSRINVPKYIPRTNLN